MDYHYISSMKSQKKPSLSDHACYAKKLARLEKNELPPVTCGEAFASNPQEVFKRLVQGLSARLKAINCRNVVIGLSGGLDSALVLLVANEVFTLRKWDKRGLHVFTMPGFGTSRRTRGNAGKICDGLGIELQVIPIARSVRQHFKDIGHDEALHDVVYENAQARMRTLILMDKANQCGGIVLGTGDMSEAALGWCTYNGDHMSMFAVNAGVPKTVVRAVCSWWARERGGVTGAAIDDVVATPVSPELLPPSKDGQIAQITEAAVGPYELHDFFLYRFTVMGQDRATILAAAAKHFKGTYQRAVIAKWLDVFLRRFFASAFKRNCQPDGIKVFSVYLGPRDYYVPSVLK